MISCRVVHLKRQTSDDDYMSCCDFEEFCEEDMTHLDTWSGNTMKRGQVQVNLIGNAGVTGHLWTLF